MPEIKRIPFDELSIDLSPEKDRMRSPGIHLSSIIKDMLRTAGINRSGRGGSGNNAGSQHLTFEKGFLWERIIEWALRAQMDVDANAAPDDLVRPGEVFMDGIYMTPDAINVREQQVEEWKSTGIRAKDFDIIARRIEWLWQGAAYARYFGFTKVVFRVWHHVDMPPVVSQFEIEWTPEEVEENWQRILDHYEFMKRRDGR